MAGRDPEDWSTVALALARSLPIWSQDKDMDAAGVTVYTTGELLDAIHDAGSGKGQPPAAAADTPVRRPRRSLIATTILVCDNEEPLRALIRATLDGGDYRLIEARDGDESLELARSALPDLILLDVMMPGRSGLEVLRELRGDPSFAATPVIMLTARAQAVDREAAEAVGADCFLAKPFSPAELVALLEQLLAGRG